MNPAIIWSMLNTFLLLGIIIYIFYINKYIDKNDIINYVKQFLKKSEEGLKEDLDNFLDDVKKDYSSNQNKIIKLMKEQQEEIEKLKKVINSETLAFKKYCQDRINIQEKIVNETEKKLQELQKELYKTQNMLSKCKKKLVNKGIKNDDENS